MKIYLDEGFNCIIYDLRGHGENERTLSVGSAAGLSGLRL